MYIIESRMANIENIILSTSMKVLSTQSIVEIIENLIWPRPQHFTRILNALFQTKDFKNFFKNFLQKEFESIFLF